MSRCTPSIYDVDIHMWCSNTRSDVVIRGVMYFMQMRWCRPWRKVSSCWLRLPLTRGGIRQQRVNTLRLSTPSQAPCQTRIRILAGTSPPHQTAPNLHIKPLHQTLGGQQSLWITWLQIGRAHVWTPVTSAHLVCRLLLEKKNITCTPASI